MTLRIFASIVAILCSISIGLAQETVLPDGPLEDEATEDSAGGPENSQAPATAPAGPVIKSAPFKDLPGRWTGEGRLGIKEGSTEKVQCRATYFVDKSGTELKQNIRCASASGKIEVKSVVNAKDGKLTGTWNELMYNVGGEMAGEVTERGFRIKVRSGDLTANMDVIVLNGRQVVEIQFFNSSLRGLMLVLKKG
jgi:hypothetical protein